MLTSAYHGAFPIHAGVDYNSLFTLHQSIKTDLKSRDYTKVFKPTVSKFVISDSHAGQRIDNFLITHYKGVPKTRLYKALRKGEVRVNRKRVNADYRLCLNDELRLPPLRQAASQSDSASSIKAKPVLKSVLTRVEESILAETPDYILLDKPAGIPVHGGSGIHSGLIEALRVLRPKAKYLELAHRLDRDTSGCLLIAKKRSLLMAVHDSWRKHHVEKRYLALLKGVWTGGERRVQAPLRKNQLAGGERIVIVDHQEGKASTTIFRPLVQYQEAVLVEARLITGRTHQIRVHAAHIGYPLAADEKYGDVEFNRQLRQQGLRRLFLHSSSLFCPLADHPLVQLGVCTDLPNDLSSVLTKLVKKLG